MEHPPILVIEDSDEDYEVLHLLLVSMGVDNPLARYSSGTEALEFINRGERSLPALIVLDLHRPETDCRELVRRFRQSKRLRPVPIIVLSASSDPGDARSCYEAGANAYLVKPAGIGRFERMLKALTEFWLQFALLPASLDNAA
ncbi:MAG: response regulator [Acetobacteraceae bacterium]|nr:response regulator [Acetobacteraceae bacterium]